MKQTIKGWTVGLIGPNKEKLFLGRYLTQERKWYATTYTTPCDYYVYSKLFNSAEEALDFWNKCNYQPYEGKDAFTPIPLKIELTVDVQGLGFDWNGLT